MLLHVTDIGKNATNQLGRSTNYELREEWRMHYPQYKPISLCGKYMNYSPHIY